MWLKNNNVITFDENDKVVVISRKRYNNREFYLMAEITSDESDITDNYKVMEAFEEGCELQKVVDVELLLNLKPSFTKKVFLKSDRVKKGVRAYFDSIEVLSCDKRDNKSNPQPKGNYSNGRGTTTSAKQAQPVQANEPEYLHAMRNRNFEALYRYAYKNPECFDFIKTEAEHGNSEAVFWVAKCFDDGYGVGEDLHKAFVLMNEAAKGGFPKAYEELCRMYNASGYGIEDRQMLVYWAQKAEEEGQGGGFYWLSESYRYGLGVERNEKIAAEYAMLDKLHKKVDNDGKWNAEVFIEIDEKFNIAHYMLLVELAINGDANARNQLLLRANKLTNCSFETSTGDIIKDWLIFLMNHGASAWANEKMKQYN